MGAMLPKVGTDAAQFLNNSFHRNNSVNGTRDMAEAKKKSAVATSLRV